MTRTGRARRERQVHRALREAVPLAPLADFEPMAAAALAGHLRHLPATVAVRLAVATHIRHGHTDYDQLLDEGYDRDAARHFVLDAMNEVLRTWGAKFEIDEKDDDEFIPSAQE